MLRNWLGLGVILGAPWLIWLGFAHLVRPWWSGEVVALITASLSVAAGMSGFWLLGFPFARWKEKYLLALLAIYTILLVLAQPFIGLLSVCTTGDCI
ncbi:MULTISPECIES: hypothetical protein [unclassified Sphingobium]|uniref:hypothetical protein n=1 Tax=unclassified Sphingobium TaxID=2611147 RepID=UPI0007F47E53|nr:MULTISPECIES: hypothetical protein [unclassified Sphingobium]OAN56103.1 hypothetical protein A7Q26_01435 [Sphingobium sp. TCM1]WIW87013.1 hypothetical protein K3M67_08315 [Sphingobium sp. V4]